MEVNMIRGIKSFISIITTVLLLISTMLGFYGTDGTKNEYKTYKNVILMIGDGMGFNTVEAAKSDTALMSFRWKLFLFTASQKHAVHQTK